MRRGATMPAGEEKAISPKTVAIMPVHCYGFPADVDAIGVIAQAHNLPVVYDAAHAFGVSLGSRSLLVHGDLAVLSFHATKVFNTFEGGAIVSRDAGSKRTIDLLRNFGIEDEVTVSSRGLNGKMSQRQQASERYRAGLAEVPGINLPSVAGGSSTTIPSCPFWLNPDTGGPGTISMHGCKKPEFWHAAISISCFQIFPSMPGAAAERPPDSRMLD